MIAVIDYGMGNLRSVLGAFKRLKVNARIVRYPSELDNADAVVLPGVGAFGDAVLNLTRTGMFSAVKNFINSGKPFLGICLGLQLLFERSYENGLHSGLGILKGEVVRFPDSVGRIPHIGWNQVWWKRKSDLWKNIETGSFFYFVHSFVVVPEDDEVIASITDYGVDFVSSVHKDNIFAVQFHPEKSHKLGELLLKNWLEFYGIVK